MKQFLKQIFSEDNGNYSSTRTMFILWCTSVLFIWISLSIYKHELLSLPESVIVIICSLGGAKIIQKFGEQKP